MMKLHFGPGASDLIPFIINLKLQNRMDFPKQSTKREHNKLYPASVWVFPIRLEARAQQTLSGFGNVD